MVIPVCFKCQNPLQIIARPQDGFEIMGYQCSLCCHTSASFLLGHIEPERPAGAQPPEKESRRARSFTDVQEQYRMRAKIQSPRVYFP